MRRSFLNESCRAWTTSFREDKGCVGPILYKFADQPPFRPHTRKQTAAH